MSAKPTPGPWKACGAKGCSCGIVFSIPADQPVATANTVWGDGPGMEYGEISKEQAIANARLIAAAPELLECLIHLIDRDWFKDGMKGDVTCVLNAEQVRAAVLKSTGGAQ